MSLEVDSYSQLSDIFPESMSHDLFNDPEVKPILDDFYHTPDPVYENNNANVEQAQFFNYDHDAVVNPAYNNANIPNNVVVEPPPSVISNEEYPGPYNFEVFIPAPHKNPWVYSAPLRKIFISMNSPFPIDFKINTVNTGLFVRATPLFSLPQFSQELVVRCIPHAQKTDSANTNVPAHIWDHVIRCQNPLAKYEGDRNEKTHLSVVVPLNSPQTGMDTVKEMYQFVCKNSCPSGMNRRPLEVVFTLEDETRQVLGRSVLSVRVCSCPKRDKEKEEKEHLKKNLPDALPHGKKRKLETCEKKLSFVQNLDTKEYDLNEVKIVGKQNLLAVLKYCHDLMCGEIVRHEHGNEQPFRKCVQEINALIKKYSE